MFDDLVGMNEPETGVRKGELVIQIREFNLNSSVAGETSPFLDDFHA